MNNEEPIMELSGKFWELSYRLATLESITATLVQDKLKADEAWVKHYTEE